MRSGVVLSSSFDVITDWHWRWQPCSVMQVHGSRRSQHSSFPTCKSQFGAACSSFDVAKDSSIARSRSSRKRANRSQSISTTANIWRNTGENVRRKGEKQLLPGVAGQIGISFSVSADLCPNAAFVRALPNEARHPDSLDLATPTIGATRLPNH